jgi:hypothetical protein
MKTLNITEKQLKAGEIFEIETIDKDDIRIAELSFSEKTNNFIIWFNGQLIHCSKGFKRMINRLELLDKKFPLDTTA